MAVAHCRNLHSALKIFNLSSFRYYRDITENGEDEDVDVHSEQRAQVKMMNGRTEKDNLPFFVTFKTKLIGQQVFQNITRLWSNGASTRLYSMYPPYYVDPIHDKLQLEKILKEKSKEEILATKVRPPANNHTCSPLIHPDVQKFINYIMTGGNRQVAVDIVNYAFTRIKHIQIRKYNMETDPEKKKNIILRPLEVFLLAVKNVTPMMWTLKIKRSGTWYKIPTGISEEKARGRAMKWLLEAANEKDSKVRLKVELANEIIAAANYEGRAVAKKIELHKLCEANRGYANYWWT